MQITLYVNNSDKKQIGKTLSDNLVITGTLRDESSITEPNILIELENPSIYNYVYIPQFKRYYFIDDIISVRNNIWLLKLSVDVLESFKSDILDLDVILRNTEKTGLSKYMNSDVWQNTVKESTTIKQFPLGLSEFGEFVLITAGG